MPSPTKTMLPEEAKAAEQYGRDLATLQSQQKQIFDAAAEIVGGFPDEDALREYSLKRTRSEYRTLPLTKEEIFEKADRKYQELHSKLTEQALTKSSVLKQAIEQGGGAGYADTFFTPEQRAAMDRGEKWTRTEQQALLDLAREAPASRVAHALMKRHSPEETARLQELLAEERYGRGEKSGVVGKTLHTLTAGGRFGAGVVEAGLGAAREVAPAAPDFNEPSAWQQFVKTATDFIGKDLGGKDLPPELRGGMIEGVQGAIRGVPDVAGQLASGNTTVRGVDVPALAKKLVGGNEGQGQKDEAALALTALGGGFVSAAGQGDDATSLYQGMRKQGQEYERAALAEAGKRLGRKYTAGDTEYLALADKLYENAMSHDVARHAIENPNAVQTVAELGLDPINVVGGQLAAPVLKVAGTGLRAAGRGTVAAGRLAARAPGIKQALASPSGVQLADAVGQSVDALKRLKKGATYYPEAKAVGEINSQAGSRLRLAREQAGATSEATFKEMGREIATIQKLVRSPEDKALLKQAIDGAIPASALPAKMRPAFDAARKLDELDTGLRSSTNIGQKFDAEGKLVAEQHVARVNPKTGLPAAYLPRNKDLDGAMEIGLPERKRANLSDAKSRKVEKDLYEDDPAARWERRLGQLRGKVPQAAEMQAAHEAAVELGVAREYAADPSSLLDARKAEGKLRHTMQVTAKADDRASRLLEKSRDLSRVAYTEAAFHRATPAPINLTQKEAVSLGERVGRGQEITKQAAEVRKQAGVLIRRAGRLKEEVSVGAQQERQTLLAEAAAKLNAAIRMPAAEQKSIAAGAKSAASVAADNADAALVKVYVEKRMLEAIPNPTSAMSARVKRLEKEAQKIAEQAHKARIRANTEAVRKPVEGSIAQTQALNEAVALERRALQGQQAIIDNPARAAGTLPMERQAISGLGKAARLTDRAQSIAPEILQDAAEEAKHNAAAVAAYEAEAQRIARLNRGAQKLSDRALKEQEIAAVGRDVRADVVHNVEVAVDRVDNHKAVIAQIEADKARLTKETGIEWGSVRGDLQAVVSKITKKPGEVKLGELRTIAPKPYIERLAQLAPVVGPEKAGAAAVESLRDFNRLIVQPFMHSARVGKTVFGGVGYTLTNFAGAIGLTQIAHGRKAFNPKLWDHAIHGALVSAGFGDGAAARTIELTLKSGEKVSLDRVLDIAKSIGLMDQFSMRAGLDSVHGGVLGKMSDKFAALGDVGGRYSLNNINRTTENFQKLASFIGFLDGTDKNSIARALDLTSQFAGNYRRLSEVEKGVKDVFMFYNWNRFILPHLTSQIVRNPQRFAMWAKGRDYLERRDRGNNLYTETAQSDYLRGTGLPAPKTMQPPLLQGKYDIGRRTEVRIEDPVSQWAGTWQGIFGSTKAGVSELLGPVAQAAIEGLTGMDAKTGERLSVPAPFDVDTFIDDSGLARTFGKAKATAFAKMLLAPIERPSSAAKNIFKLYWMDADKPLDELDFGMRLKAARDFGFLAQALDALTGRDVAIGSVVPGVSYVPVDTVRTAARRQRDVGETMTSGEYQMGKP